MAKTCWRVAVEDLDLDLRYGGRSLLDFMFAYDILIYGTSYHLIGIGTHKHSHPMAWMTTSNWRNPQPAMLTTAFKEQTC